MKENLSCKHEDNSCNREKMGCEGCKYLKEENKNNGNKAISFGLSSVQLSWLANRLDEDWEVNNG